MPALLALAGLAKCGATEPTSTTSADSYTNPVVIRTAGGAPVTNCPDPAVIRAEPPDAAWYMYCTGAAVNDADRGHDGKLRPRGLLIYRSQDLVHWEQAGEAFASRPGWVAEDSGLWAPDVRHFDGQYFLYYSVTKARAPAGEFAIGVATSPTPAGPWSDSGAPVVEPQGTPRGARWVIDPAVIEDDEGRRYLYYGSYRGGISVRPLSADGLRTDPATETPVTIGERYEAAYVVRRGGFYYLFVSATNCCNGPLTGYSVFAGRSPSPLGPFLDREGVPLLAGRVGGTPVLSMNGNRWVGPGHNAVVTDLAGQDWFVYHAIDRTDPYFGEPHPDTRRPVLIDPLGWSADGWPAVRGGLWASDGPQPAPAARPEQRAGDAPSSPVLPARAPGALVAASSDELDGVRLGSRLAWVRPPPAAGYRLSAGALHFATQAADLHLASNNASVLTLPAPRGDYLVETRVTLDLPAEGCCHNFVQAGLVIHGGDDRYLKLVHVSMFESRQTEFAKEDVLAGRGPSYGNTVVGPPGETTWLRIGKSDEGGQELYTAYTSRDGATWVRGGTWAHALGEGARIGLVSMGGAGFTARFDHLRTYEWIRPPDPRR